MHKVFFVIIVFLLAACSSDSDDNVRELQSYDFAAVDASLQEFLDSRDDFHGTSIVIVEKSKGIIHQAAFGNHNLETVVLLASTSKMPSVSVLMSMHDDIALDFDINTPIENYLPWIGSYPTVTVQQLVSNTSGIPGLNYIEDYGPLFCQFLPVGQLSDCAQTIYLSESMSPVNAPGTQFDYGGSPWQLAGGIAEIVSGSTWRQLVDERLVQPCGLEVFQYGNNLSIATQWAGNPDDLAGLDNPSPEGGALSNLADYAKLLLMQLNDGRCADTQVLSRDSIDTMRKDVGTPLGSREWSSTLSADQPVGWGYGMGWWVLPPVEGSEPSIFVDPGAFGTVAWIDINRDYGAYIQLEEYTITTAGEGTGYMMLNVLPLIEAAIDAVNP